MQTLRARPSEVDLSHAFHRDSPKRETELARILSPYSYEEPGNRRPKSLGGLFEELDVCVDCLSTEGGR